MTHFPYNDGKEVKQMELQATKAYLKANKITYEQLSEKSGIPLNTIKNILSGRTPNPRIDTIQAIERALDLNPSSIEWTNEEKAAGVVPNYREKLSADETEIIDMYRAIKSEKGEQATHAIKVMMQALLNGK